MARKNHKDLIVWQKALKLAHIAPLATARFPRHELFGLSSKSGDLLFQCRATLRKERRAPQRGSSSNSFTSARGSLAELETQIYLAMQSEYIENAEPLLWQVEEVGKLLNAVIRGFRRRLVPQHR